MKTKTVLSSDKILMKNGIIHCDGQAYDLKNLERVLVQVSDLTFLSDTVRLVLIFKADTLIVPSLHPQYDMIFEKLIKAIHIDNDAYMRAMNCDVECEFELYRKGA